MRKQAMPLLIALLMLTACASGGQPMPGLKLTPPAPQMASCPSLPQPTDTSWTALLANHIQVAKQYHQCRDNHQALVNWLQATD